MIPALLEGRGDVAMGNLTITPEALKHVDFTNPLIRNVSEILVTGPGADPVATVEDLSGREVYVGSRRATTKASSSSTWGSSERRSTVKIRLAPENLEPRTSLRWCKPASSR